MRQANVTKAATAKLYDACQDLFRRHPRATLHERRRSERGIESVRVLRGIDENQRDITITHWPANSIELTDGYHVNHNGHTWFTRWTQPRPVPESLMDLLGAMTPLPYPSTTEIYHLVNDAGQEVAIVIVDEHRLKLAVRRLPATPRPLSWEERQADYYMSAAEFWCLYDAGRLRLTNTGYAELGYLWQPFYGRNAKPGDVRAPRGYISAEIDPARLTLVNAPRYPLDLPMHPDHGGSCGACVLAQIRWMYGLSDAHTAEEADRLIGREHHQGTQVAQGTYQLLQDGFRVTGLSDFDNDRFAAEGVAYLREHDRRFWNEGFDLFCASAEYAQGVELGHRTIEAYRREFGHHYELQARQPNLDDIRRFIHDDQPVLIDFYWPGYTGEGSHRLVHALLVFGLYGESFVVYNPQVRARTLQLFSAQEMTNFWIPEYGIRAIRRP